MSNTVTLSALQNSGRRASLRLAILYTTLIWKSEHGFVPGYPPPPSLRTWQTSA